MKRHKVGVFDSGRGGRSVAQAIEKSLPNVDVDFLYDVDNFPYGDKPMSDVFGFVLPLLKKLEKNGCEAIVVACNTVTTNMLHQLQEKINVPLIGVEPMVKSAAEQTQTGVICVCATPGTLGSDRYEWLKEHYAKHIVVIEPDCRKWAYMIESNELDHEFIKKQIDEACDNKADVIVLGCTHYHWIEEDIRRIAAGRALVLQPEQSIIRRVVRVLEESETS